MKKIMILGSRSMLGHMVYHYLKGLNKYNITDASFPEKLHEGSKLLDVTNAVELEKYINTEKPDILVNCIGVLIKGSQTDPSNAIYLNSYFPHQLAKILRKTGGKLIHISTDCVFSGIKGSYTENDFRDADDTYGRSKALGEVINDTDLTLRTSIIGPELKEKGEGLFHWFMTQNGEINGFTQALWGGVTTLELAKVIDKVIEQKINGLIHITNELPISKYEIVSLFKKIWSKSSIDIHPSDANSSNKSLKSIRTDFNHAVPNYEEMLKDQYDWMETHREQYEHYLY